VPLRLPSQPDRSRREPGEGEDAQRVHDQEVKRLKEEGVAPRLTIATVTYVPITTIAGTQTAESQPRRRCVFIDPVAANAFCKTYSHM
jgi:hypothetical protein